MGVNVLIITSFYTLLLPRSAGAAWGGFVGLGRWGEESQGISLDRASQAECIAALDAGPMGNSIIGPWKHARPDESDIGL